MFTSQQTANKIQTLSKANTFNDVQLPIYRKLTVHAGETVNYHVAFLSLKTANNRMDQFKPQCPGRGNGLGNKRVDLPRVELVSSAVDIGLLSPTSAPIK